VCDKIWALDSTPLKEAQKLQLPRVTLVACANINFYPIKFKGTYFEMIKVSFLSEK